MVRNKFFDELSGLVKQVVYKYRQLQYVLICRRGTVNHASQQC